jgi:hypothetical protein
MTTSWFSELLSPLPLIISADFWKRLACGLVEIIRLMCRCVQGRLPSPPRTDCCVDLPADVYKRADPLIYAQYYLMSKGLAVTWDNPDIEIFDGHALVTGELKPQHRYRVRARVWNGSYDAPAIGVAVELSYLSFGVQTVSNKVAVQSVSLGAKGTVQHPAFADFNWETPAEGGHYCLQIRLGWNDDANPDNNLGQKNVTVAEAHSPAVFSFPVRNDASVPRRFTIEADAYELPELPRCADITDVRERHRTRLQESRARWAETLRQQAYGSQPLPSDWRVDISPSDFGLNARQQKQIQVSIEPMNATFQGEKTFNIHVFALGNRESYALGDRGAKSLAGGVSLRVHRA